MSRYELIPDSAYQNLPQDTNDQFVVLVGVAQANLARLLDQSSGNDLDLELRSQFMSTICGIAEALHIEGLPPLGSNLGDYEQYHKFQVFLAGIVAKVRLQSNLVARPYSVALGHKTKARIRFEIKKLRDMVSVADIPSKKRDSLLGKLDEFEEELDKQRLSFAKTMAISAHVVAALGGLSATFADGPKAIDNMVKVIGLIGDDKELEEENRLRLLPAPPKALPNHTGGKAPTAKPSVDFDDDDDDVPF